MVVKDRRSDEAKIAFYFFWVSEKQNASFQIGYHPLILLYWRDVSTENRRFHFLLSKNLVSDTLT